MLKNTNIVLAGIAVGAMAVVGSVALVNTSSSSAVDGVAILHWEDQR